MIMGEFSPILEELYISKPENICSPFLGLWDFQVLAGPAGEKEPPPPPLAVVACCTSVAFILFSSLMTHIGFAFSCFTGGFVFL
jgi:hypothetical protein